LLQVLKYKAVLIRRRRIDERACDFSYQLQTFNFSIEKMQTDYYFIETPKGSMHVQSWSAVLQELQCDGQALKPTGDVYALDGQPDVTVTRIVFRVSSNSAFSSVVRQEEKAEDFKTPERRPKVHTPRASFQEPSVWSPVTPRMIWK
jgi:hypothetical protein